MAPPVNNLQPIVPSFWTGPGSPRLGPDQIARDRQIASLLMAPQAQPVNNWADGAAQLVNSFNGAMLTNRAAANERLNMTQGAPVPQSMTMANPAFSGVGRQIINGLFGRK